MISIVFRWFGEYREFDYARSGNSATKDVTIPAGNENWDFHSHFIYNSVVNCIATKLFEM